jgi:hypothetical protein
MAEKKKWSKREDRLIAKHYKYNICKLFELLPGRSEMAITVRANRLGLSRRPWMAVEDEVIRKHYPDYGPEYCGRFCKGRTIIAIQSRALKLGVKRDLTKRRDKVPNYDVDEMEKLMMCKPWGKNNER